jgi:hypothetical protein
MKARVERNMRTKTTWEIPVSNPMSEKCLADDLPIESSCLCHQSSRRWGGRERQKALKLGRRSERRLELGGGETWLS